MKDYFPDYSEKYFELRNDICTRLLSFSFQAFSYQAFSYQVVLLVWIDSPQ